MLPLRRFLPALLGLALITPAARAQDDNDKKPKPPDPEAKVPTLEWKARHVFKTKNRAAWLSLSPDGKLLAVGDGAVGQLWDTRKGEQVGRFGAKGVVIGRNLFSPDGKTLAFTSVGGREIYLFDLGQGKVVRTLSGHENAITTTPAFAPDGKTLAEASLMDGVTLWDVGTGKARPLGRFPDKQRPEALAFSPDGKTLAVATEEAVLRLFDVAKGEEIRKLSSANCYRCPSGIAFSPDGRLLALGVWMDNVVAVWDRREGRLLREHTWPKDHQGDRTNGTNSLVFAADGRTLIAACCDQRVRVWEVTTGGLRCRIETAVHGLSIARSGALLAHTSRDQELCLWDAHTGLGEGGGSLPESDKVWSTLGDDASKAFAVMRGLAASPREAVPLLDKRLPTAPAVEESVVDALVADLDAEDFDARDKASGRLAQLGEVARDALSKARTKDTSPEAGRRIKELLEKLDGPPDGERLRLLRAVEVLESIGTPEARKALKRLAGGEAKALLTRQAKAALERLGPN
jgi:WD40 repeat protein